MGWKEQYRQARFRNALFFVDSADTDFGRRLVVHEFPNEDKPATQDLGRSVRRFSVSGYVLGDDYLIARNALQKACEEEGPGELVHPYYGSLSVSCENISFRDSKSETRISRFSITFVEFNILLSLPTRVIDTVGTLRSARQAALTALNSAFLRVYSIAQKPFAIIQNVENTIDNAFTYVDKVRRTVNSTAGFQRSITDVFDKVETLVYDSEELINSIIDIITFGTLSDEEGFANARSQYSEIKNLFDYTPSSILNVNDPSVEVARAWQEASVIVCCGLVLEIQFDSYEDAIGIQNQLMVQIDKISKFSSLDDELGIALQDLQTAMINYLAEVSSDLSRVVSLILPETTPALVISYSLYGDVDREQDILDRNRIDHPGFVFGGTGIEVLVNAG